MGPILIKFWRIRIFLVVTAVIFFAGNSMRAQKSESILDYDTIVYEKSMERAYDIWKSSKYSKDHTIDTILCAFVLEFDTIELDENNMEGKDLKRLLKLSIGEDSLYKCECEVYNLQEKSIANFGVFNDYRIFHRDDYNYWAPEPLIARIRINEDRMMLIPQSNRYTFNFRWRAIIEKNGELSWIKTDNPKITYKSKEVYRKHWDEFIIGGKKE